MRHLILHIGQEKTGTTTLQHTLAASQAALLDHDVLYAPRLFTGNHRGIIPHFLGCEAMYPRRDVQLGRSDADYLRNSKAEWEAICAAAADHPAQTMVISAEQLFMAGLYPGFAAMIDGLRSLAERITVVAYLRDPASHYLSLVQEILKVHGDIPSRIGSRNRDCLSPYLSADGFAVTVHRYAPDQLHQGDIVADFLARHLPHVPLAALTRPVMQANTSLSAEAMAVLQACHAGRFPQSHPHLRKSGARILRWVQDADATAPGFARPALKPGMAARIHADSTELDWLSETFGITVPAPEEPALAGQIPDQVTDLCRINQARLEHIWQAVSDRHAAEHSLTGRVSRLGRRAKRNYVTLWRRLTAPFH